LSAERSGDEMNVRDVLQGRIVELQSEIGLLAADVARLETLHAEASQLEAALAQAQQLEAQIQEMAQTTGALGGVSNDLLVKFGIVSPVEPPIPQPVNARAKQPAIAPKPAPVVAPASPVVAKKIGSGDGQAGASQPTSGGQPITYEDIFADSPAPAPVITPVPVSAPAITPVPAPRVNDQRQAVATSVAQQSADSPGTAATSNLPADEPEEDVWAALVDEEELDGILAVTDPFAA